MNEEEKQIFFKVKENKEEIYQSELIALTGLSKVKITRILDKLEQQQIIERKRRGMTNRITLK